MKKCLCVIGLFFVAITSNAQALKKMFVKIAEHNNVSYSDISEQQWSTDEKPSIDTNKVFITYVPDEQKSGSYFKIVEKTVTYWYDGVKLLLLDKGDHTYQFIDYPQYQQTLLYFERQLKPFIDQPNKIKQLRDTVYDSVPSYHAFLMAKDSIENQKHTFIRVDYFIDKRSFLPVAVNVSQQGFDGAGTLLGLVEKHRFKNYHFDAPKFPKLSSAAIPNDYKPHTTAHVEPLANGTKAPAIKLYDLQGKEWKLENLKNKTVLLSFDFVGCIHCVDAEQVLKKLSDKYQGAPVFIAIIYPVDKAQAVIKHNQISKINTPSFITDRSARSTYPFVGYPAFYVIDKKGYIAGNYPGFSDDLQAQLTKIIDSDR